MVFVWSWLDQDWFYKVWLDYLYFYMGCRSCYFHIQLTNHRTGLTNHWICSLVFLAVDILIHLGINKHLNRLNVNYKTLPDLGTLVHNPANNSLTLDKLSYCCSLIAITIDLVVTHNNDCHHAPIHVQSVNLIALNHDWLTISLIRVSN